MDEFNWIVVYKDGSSDNYYSVSALTVLLFISEREYDVYSITCLR